MINGEILKIIHFIILIPTPDFPHFYYMLGGNVGSLLYGDVSVMRMSRVMRKSVFGVPTRFDTNKAVQRQSMTIDLNIRIWEVEDFYSLCSKNKGSHQRLFLRLCQIQAFSCHGSFYLSPL